jgi:pyruvate kinase
MVSRYKPACPIIACTVSPRICRQLNLSWGVVPLWIARESSTDDLFEEAVRTAEEAGYIGKGDRVVITAGIPLGVSGKTNMIRVVEV